MALSKEKKSAYKNSSSDFPFRQQSQTTASLHYISMTI